MAFLVAILVTITIVTLGYVIKLLVALRQLVITAEFRIRATTERVETTMIDADALIQSANILVSDLNTKLPGVVEQATGLLDDLQTELVPALHHVQETTASVSEVSQVISARIASLNKALSWMPVAGISKRYSSVNTKLGILGVFVLAAVTVGLPHFMARPTTSGYPLQ